jgi:hypothetical protein
MQKHLIIAWGTAFRSLNAGGVEAEVPRFEVAAR